jgi:hypothetical protein
MPAPTPAAGDRLLDIGWNPAPVRQAEVDVEPDIFEVLRARLAEMENVDATWAEGRETFPICRKDWHYLDDRLGPVISHRPTVTVFRGEGQIVLSGPIAASETWKPPADLGEKAIAGWTRFTNERDQATANADVNAWMRFASRIDVDDEEEGPTRKGEIPDHVLQKIQQPAKDRAAIRERLQEFKHAAPMMSVAGRRYESFTERFVCDDGRVTAKRSDLKLRCLELYNMRLPKNAEYGYDKTWILKSKDTGIEPIFLRDAPYLTIGYWTVRGQIAVDLDTVWPDLKTLRKALRKALGPHLFPNIIVYRLNAKGEIENPHLIWILPPGSEVGVCGKSRSRPIRTYNMVQRALVSHLIPLGADAGYLNVGKTKNPLSPYWSIACSDESFCTLEDFIERLPTVNTNEKEMRRRMAKVRGVKVEDLKGSMPDWKALTDIFQQEYTAGFRSRCEEFKAARESESAFRAWAEKHVTPRALSEIADNFDVRRMLKKQIDWRCRNRPTRRTSQYDGDNRFRDAEAQEAENLIGAELPEARKIQGDKRKELAGAITRANQGAASRAIMRDQIALFERIGGDVADETAVASWIIRSGKLKKSTVYKWLDAVLTRFRDASRYIASPDTNFEAAHVIVPEQEVGRSESPDPATQTIEPDLHPVSGEYSTAQTSLSTRDPDPRRRPMRDLDDDPMLEAVEIMRLCGHGAPAGSQPVPGRSSGPPARRTLH